MTEDVIFKGYSASPADRVCEDGTLSASMNIVPENGAMYPVDRPSFKFALPKGYRILCIHKIGTIANYIFANNSGKLSYCDADSVDNGLSDIDSTGYSFGEIHKVTPIGATLCVIADNGVFYVKWEAGKGYKFLGNEIPFPELQFSCYGSMTKGDTFEVPMENTFFFAPFVVDETDQKKVSDAVFGAVNKFIAEKVTGKGLFCMPFFVRYALRLYDGSLTMHSAPVLMLGTGLRGPYVNFVKGDGETKTYKKSRFAKVICPTFQLRAEVLNEGVVIGHLKDWKDIVKSVDVFVSQPIYSIDINEKIKYFERYEDVELSVRMEKKTYHTDFSGDTTIKHVYGTYTLEDLWTPDGSEDNNIFVDMPMKEDSEKQYESAGNFYLIKSFGIDEETGKIQFDKSYIRNRVQDTVVLVEDGLINVADDYLQSLAEREVMTDDFNYHNRIYAKNAIEYNSRLNLCGIRRQLWHRMNGGLFMQCYPYNNDNASNTPEGAVKCIAYFHITKDGRNYIVQSRTFSHCKDYNYDYIFYPDTGCTQITIRSTTTGKCLVIPMRQHEFLNGAYSFTTEKREWVESDVPQVSDDIFVDYGNRVFTSEVNNPFLFLAENIYSIGNGNVLAMCSASKAMSQGQFGQFPLYCFTDEGVWALDVSSTTGAFSSRHPVTRDVVKSPESILQLDSEVAFCTDRGIMLLSGSQSQCITDVLDSREVFSPTRLQKFKEFIGGFNSDEVSKFLSLTYLRFEEYVKTASMIYDYSHQRIVVFNTREDIPYAYVFSIKEKAWGMMMLDAASTVNSYPASLFCDNSGNVYDMSVTSDDGDDTFCLIVTRPIKLGSPDVFKRVRMLINRTVTRARNNVSQVLYGSNDLNNWHIVTSSNNDRMGVVSGTPYKYFILMALYRMEHDNYTTGLSIDFNTTLTNRLR